MIRFSIYVLLAFVLLSCGKDTRWACFTPYGSEVSEVRSLEAFTYVEGYNKIDVTISQGSEQKVEVIAGKHIIKNIKTTVKDGVLQIEDKNTCNFVRGYKHVMKVNITMPSLVKASNFGVGTIRLSDNFRQDSVFALCENSGDIRISGTYKKIQTSSHGNGDIYLSGTSEVLMAYSSGVNFLQAFDLTVTGYIFVASLSLGDCNINAAEADLVQYDITDRGNIQYKGTPGAINGTIRPDAKGQLIKVD